MHQIPKNDLKIFARFLKNPSASLLAMFMEASHNVSQYYLQLKEIADKMNPKPKAKVKEEKPKDPKKPHEEVKPETPEEAPQPVMPNEPVEMHAMIEGSIAEKLEHVAHSPEQKAIPLWLLPILQEAAKMGLDALTSLFKKWFPA